MPELDVSAFGRNVELIAQALRTLDETILIGWPGNKYPTTAQGEKIVAVYHELSIQDKSMDLAPSDRWHLAGQIVARLDRDCKE